MSRGRPAQEHSTSSRIRRFFEENPDEELTYRDMALKFSVSIHTLRDAIKGLTRTGVVESLHIIRRRRGAPKPP